jgi:hypothetical protein
MTNQWVRLSDGPPAQGQWVLALWASDSTRRPRVALYNPWGWHGDNAALIPPDYWMPLPDDPEAVTKDVTPDEMTPAQLCESLRTNYCVGDAVERCGICGPCIAAEMIERLSGAAEPSCDHIFVAMPIVDVCAKCGLAAPKDAL